MAGRTLRPRTLLRSVAVAALFSSTLILLITTDTFAHGTLFVFPAWLGVIISITGVAGAVLALVRRGPAIALLRWHAGLGLVFVPVYSLLDPSASTNPGLIALGVIWAAVLVVLTLPAVKALLHTHPHGPAYLRLHWSLLVIVMVAIVGLVGIWAIDWEARYGLFGRPNGDGVSTFVNEISHPRISIAVDGGFVYRLTDRVTAGTESGPSELLGEVTVKMLSPHAEVSVTGYERGTIRLTLLNYDPERMIVLVDGAEAKVTPTRSAETRRYELLELRQLPEAGQVNSREFLESAKGYWLDIPVETQHETLVRIQRTGPVEEIHAYVLSDLHSGYTVSYPVLTELMTTDPDFIVLNGDTVNNGYLSEYVVAASVAENSLVPIYTTQGNHDVWSHGDRIYRQYFGPSRYSFDLGDARFIILDSASGYLGNDQIEWLEDELASAPGGPVIVLSHMCPVDPVTGAWDDSEVSHPELRHSLHSKAESDRLLALLSEYDVDAYLAGHNHEHGDVTIGGVRYVTGGALGGTVGEGDSVSYLDVQVSGDSVQIENVDVTDMADVANQEVANSLQAARVFVTPFITTRSLRVTLTVVWLLALNLVLVALARRLVAHPGHVL